MYEEICNIDDFEKLFPNLVSDVRSGKIATDGLYIYKLIQTKRAKARFNGGLVKRKAIVDYKMDEGWGYGHAQAEKPSTEETSWKSHALSVAKQAIFDW